MDILQHWKPQLNHSSFIQGNISDDFWFTFLDIITLSHAIEHWGDNKRKYSSKNDRKSKDEFKKYEDREMRARFLAAEKIWNLEKFIKNTYDENLFRHIVLVTGISKTSRSHEVALFSRLCINSFP